MKSSFTVAFLSLLSAATAQLHLRGNLDVNGTLEIDTTVTLSSASISKTSPVLEDRSFAFNLPEGGEYVLSVNNRKFTFLTYALKITNDLEKVDVDARIYQAGPAAFSLPGSKVAHPLVLPAVGETIYVEKPGGFNIVSIVMGNPLILLLGVGAILMVAMPWLMSFVDPETLKEVAEQQKDMHSMMGATVNPVEISLRKMRLDSTILIFVSFLSFTSIIAQPPTYQTAVPGGLLDTPPSSSPDNRPTLPGPHRLSKRQDIGAISSAVDQVLAAGQAHQSAVNNLQAVFAANSFAGAAADAANQQLQVISAGLAQTTQAEVDLQSALQSAQDTFNGADGAAGGAFGGRRKRKF
ncbi:ER membrane protein complex subunit 7, partial [Phenoliferia sp. Uapishka_3]